MNSKDLANNTKATVGYAGGTIASSTTTTSTVVIDMQGFESLMFTVHAGTWTDGAHLLKILETDNPDGTTGAAEVASYGVQDTIGASNVVKKVGCGPGLRYRTLSIASTGVTSGVVLKSAVALLGGAKNAPVA